MKIAFPAGSLSYRGTHVALYDYAYFNQEILGNESLICVDDLNPGPTDLLKKFENKFECIKVKNWEDASKKCLAANCDAAYVLKSGEVDSQYLIDFPNFIHAVFPQPYKEQHGAVYAFVSEWLSRECSNGAIPFVPHIINLPEVESNFRKFLNIPNDAIVFGCYGGYDSFDIDFVHKTLIDLCFKTKKIWFVFMNIKPFAVHERLIFMPATTDPVQKKEFINTCDAMLHARGMGESFGLACGEFSVSNRPVITYGLSPQRAHIHMLGNKAMIYRGPNELFKLLIDFDPKWSSRENWDAYSINFSAKPVMDKFNEVFIKNIFSKKNNNIKLNLIDRVMVEIYNVKRRLRSRSRKFHHGFS